MKAWEQKYCAILLFIDILPTQLSREKELCLVTTTPFILLFC